jgi:hypothetical protein
MWPIVPPVMTLAGAIVAILFLAGFLRDGAIHLGWVDPRRPNIFRAPAGPPGKDLAAVLRCWMCCPRPALISAAARFRRPCASVESAVAAPRGSPSS